MSGILLFGAFQKGEDSKHFALPWFAAVVAESFLLMHHFLTSCNRNRNCLIYSQNRITFTCSGNSAPKFGTKESLYWKNDRIRLISWAAEDLLQTWRQGNAFILQTKANKKFFLHIFPQQEETLQRRSQWLLLTEWKNEMQNNFLLASHMNWHRIIDQVILKSLQFKLNCSFGIHILLDKTATI